MAAPLLLLHSETPAQTRAVFRDADPRPWGARKLWCVCARVFVSAHGFPGTWSCAVPCVHVFICLWPVHVCVHVFMCVYVFLCICVCVCMRAFRTSSHIQLVQGSICIQRGLSDGGRPSFLTLEHVHQGEMLNFVEFL